jgi:hypothetical protein
MNGEQQYKTVDKFDRLAGALANLPDVTESKPSTVMAHTALIGETQTFIIQTRRQREVGDWVFLQYVDANGATRIVIPPQAAEVIARQRDALSTKNRKKAGREQAAARKARGELPAFLKSKKKRKAGE